MRLVAGGALLLAAGLSAELSERGGVVAAAGVAGIVVALVALATVLPALLVGRADRDPGEQSPPGP